MLSELTIFEDSYWCEGRFRPLKYWISSSLSDRRNQIAERISRIQRGLIQTKQFGGNKTLHIGTVEEVMAEPEPDVFYISDVALRELTEEGFKHFHVSNDFRRCVSLCFYDCYFAGNNLQKLSDIIHLCAGSVSGLDEIDTITHFVSDTPIVPDALSAKADIKIVSSSWVVKSFREKRQLEIVSVEPFHGLTFTSTDLDSQTSRALKKIVRNNGGNWHDAFDDSITCLIAERLSSTPKVRLALSEGVPIIKPAWIHDQANGMISPEPYLLNFWCWKKTKSELFKGISFAIHIDCENRDLLIEAIKANSGKFSNTPDMLIVPHFYVSKHDTKAVTDTWIWSCISEQKILTTTSVPAFSAFPFEKPSGLEGYVVALYKIHEPYRYQITEGLRCLGITVHFKVSEFAKIVVATEMDQGLKGFVERYHVDVVKLLWANELLKTGKLPPVREYKFLTGSKDISALCKEITSNISTKTHTSPKRVFVTSRDMDAFSDEEFEVPTSPQMTVTYDLRTDTGIGSDGNELKLDPLMSLLAV